MQQVGDTMQKITILILCICAAMSITGMERRNNACPIRRQQEHRYRDVSYSSPAQHAPSSSAQDKYAIECPICLEDVQTNNQTTLSCGHTYCITCLHTIIKTGLKEQTTIAMRCPDPYCNQRALEDEEIRSIIGNNEPMLNKYTALGIATFFREQTYNQNLKHCPTPDCRYAFINDNNSHEETTCPSCNASYCANCLIKHSAINCDQARIQHRSNDIITSEEWIASNTKQCPSCKKPIEKNGGCDHMTCTCHTEFNWTNLRLMITDWNNRQISFHDRMRFLARLAPPVIIFELLLAYALYH